MRYTVDVRECSKCHTSKSEDQFYEKKFRSRSWVSHICKECTKAYERERHRTWYRDKHLQIQKNYHRRLKRELIAAYGGKCNCCGETTFEFLQLDHTNGGGHTHRKSLTLHMSAHLKKLGYPKQGYQILCANCNFSLGIYGYCPHSHEC